MYVTLLFYKRYDEDEKTHNIMYTYMVCFENVMYLSVTIYLSISMY